ncbi:MAG: hypothetical protein JSU61_00250 [Fidelibacterota bacterium]|nr:MAG: hypothetical protein JSU61_00250 [Candidatus Neomarinimicrobiota bacterium]
MPSLKPAIFILILSPFLSATSILAQDGGELPRLGIGTDFNGYNVYVPIRIAPRLRLEPSVELSIVSEEELGTTSTYNFLDVGAGLFLLSSHAESNLYAGARIWYTYRRSYFTPSGGEEHKWQRDGFYLVPTIGGEYFLAPTFSLGAEAQLSYHRETGTTDDVKHDRSRIYTNGVIFVRFYFPGR